MRRSVRLNANELKEELAAAEVLEDATVWTHHRKGTNREVEEEEEEEEKVPQLLARDSIPREEEFEELDSNRELQDLREFREMNALANFGNYTGFAGLEKDHVSDGSANIVEMEEDAQEPVSGF